ncbi:MAG: hypothetical protein KF715_19610 [Candidatus Didemnitutus sp.]|nr:hypothetical protein [Candidatus Didemnitutus sp.]
MQTKHRLLSALAAGALVLTAFAHHESAENKINARADGPTADFVDLDVRLKRMGLAPEKSATPFVPVLTLTPGYARNPSLTPSGDSAAFLGATLGFNYEKRDTVARTVLSDGYELGGLFFTDHEDDNNEVDQHAFVSLQGELARTVQYRVTLSDTQIDIDYRNLLNVAAATAEFRTSLGDNLTGGVAYTCQIREIQLPVTNSRGDGDAYRHIPSVFLGTDPSRYNSRLPKVSLAYSYYYNLADGADEDFAAYRLALRAVDFQLGAGLTADFDASYEDRSGENFSSRLGGLERRGDYLTKVNLSLNHELLSLAGSTFSLLAGYERSRSNVASANYHGCTYAATLSFRF